MRINYNQGRHINDRSVNSKVNRRNEEGQALILIALTFIALLGFLGLTVDVGRLFIYNGLLRRAVDAAALAAAAQYREGRDFDDMAAMAKQVMNLNGVDPITVAIQTCDTNPGDSTLCTTPPRKLIRVAGEIEVVMTFLNVVGLRNVTIGANAIGEAASMDVVLVIDISESMADDASLCDGDDDDGDGVVDDGRPEGWCLGGLPSIPAGGPGNRPDDYNRDPSRCNPGDECYPFQEVKAAAANFVNRILDELPNKEEDRLAIITFSNGWESPSDWKGTRVVPPGWINNNSNALNTINNLRVYQPEVCPSAVGPCRNYDTGNPSGNYLGFECPIYRDTGDPSSCTTTNIGGALQLAGNMFATDPRPGALWVVILLTDGAANSSNSDPPTFPFGYCPSTTWGPPFCRDLLSSTRHPSNNTSYDADDFARDMADFVGCYPTNPSASCVTAGQGAVIFTIGLGDKVLKDYSPGDPAHGVSLLRYISSVGYDGDPSTDPCNGLYDNENEWKEWCGNYYFSPTGDQLTQVFEDIASRIFTRLTH